MHLDHVLLALLVLLVLSAASVAIFERLGLGAVLGLLAAGVVLGPSGLGLARRVAELREFSELGIVFLLFIIGLEMRPERLWALRRAVFAMGSAQMVLTGAALAAFIFAIGNPWDRALILGLGLALSSTAFVLPLLDERGERDTAYGRTAFGILLFQDLAIVPLLALVPILADQEPSAAHGSILLRIGVVAADLAGMYIVGRFIILRALHALALRRSSEAFAMLAVAAVVGAAWAMLRVGVSMALGAFMMGVLLSQSPDRPRIQAVVEPFKGALVGLFFIAVGMAIDIGLIPDVGLVLALHMVLLIAIKAAVLFGLCVAFGLGRVAALRVALLLAQSGEFGFVLFGAARAAGLLSADGFAYAALLISVSMAATPILAKLADTIRPPRAA
jgi:glutathione-regulated potassium-efflux system protein KefB